MNAERLLAHYEKIADAPDAIARLRRFVLDLAVRGKLVAQDTTDEPASELLKRIAAEKARLVKAGAIKARDVSGRDRGEPIIFDCPMGWSLTDLGEVALKITDGAHKTPTYVEKGVPFVSVKDFSGGKLDLSNTRFIPESEHQVLYQRCDPRRGDILLGRIGTLGKAVLVATDVEFSLFVSVGLIRFDHKSIDPIFFRSLLNSPFVEAEFDRIKIGGGTHTNKLNLGDLHTVAVPLPPLAEQHRIVAKVDELMALCDRLDAARAARDATRDRLTTASLARLNAPDPETFADDARFALDTLPALTARADQIKQLRQTILNLAVRGKLVPQDPNDEPASELLKRITKEKARLVKAGRTRQDITDPLAPTDQHAFPIPNSWLWVPTTFPTYAVSDLGKKVQTKEVLPTGAFPVVDQGKVLVRGYCDDPEKVIRVADPMIVFGDHTRETKLIDFDFVVGADGVKLLQPVCVDASYYFLALQWLPLDSRGYGRHFKLLKASALPLPPLAEQRRIVAKVDELMALCDRLEASLATADKTRSHLLEALLVEALAAADTRELEAAE